MHRAVCSYNTRLTKEAKSEFEKDFFQNNSVFGKTMGNVRKDRYIKLVTTEEKIVKLVSKPNYHTLKHFSKNLLVIEIKNTKVKMNKPVYLDKSILDISKTLMCGFWYHYLKTKDKDKAKLCYIDTESFLINTFTKDIFEDINNDAERWFDTSNYDATDKILLPMSMNKKVTWMFKDELGGKILKEFYAFPAKAYTYIMDDDSEKKKAKGIKKVCNENLELVFEHY